MKKMFVIAISSVLLIAAAFLGYGIYLNSKSDNIIIDRMSNQIVQLNGTVAKEVYIHPVFTLNNIMLNSVSITDAIALVDGNIEELYISKNSVVKKGDPLARLSNPDIPLKIASTNSALKRAQAALTQASNSYKRYKSLDELNATSKEKLDEAEANFHACEAAVEEAEAQHEQAMLMEERLIIRAPVDGSTSIVYKNIGSRMSVGMPLCLVNNFDLMWFGIDVDDKQCRSLRPGMKVLIRFPYETFDKVYATEYAAGNKGRNQEFPAVLNGIFPDLSKPAATRRIIWHIDNSSAVLEPRNYKCMEIHPDVSVKVLAVPVSALRDKQQNELFVVGKDGILEQRNVVTGRTDGHNIEILEGLSAGEVVVTYGTAELQNGIKVEVHYNRQGGEQYEGE